MNWTLPTVGQLIIIGAYVLVLTIPAALLGWIGWDIWIRVSVIWLLVDLIHGYYNLTRGNENAST